MSDQTKPADPPTPAPTPVVEPKTFTVVNNGSSLPVWISLGVSVLVSCVLGWSIYRQTFPPGPPVPPPPVVEPTVFVPADSIATKDGIRLDADKTKLLCDLANAGDGTFVLRYQPIGKKEVSRTVVVSGDNKPAPPIVNPDVPKPDDPPPPAPVDPNTKVTAVTYVYEKDQGGIPNHVSTALNKINRDSNFQIVATIFEDDSTTGPGSVPAQYKAAYDEAKKLGTPALVVIAGDKVLRSVKAPKTEQEILEAAK